MSVLASRLLFRRQSSALAVGLAKPYISQVRFASTMGHPKTTHATEAAEGSMSGGRDAVSKKNPFESYLDHEESPARGQKFATFESTDYAATLAFNNLSKSGDRTNMTLIVKRHTDKAFLVAGDTKPNKDKIKQLGGKWNQEVVGWVFPLSRKKEIVAELSTVAEVLQADDILDQDSCTGEEDSMDHHSEASMSICAEESAANPADGPRLSNIVTTSLSAEDQAKFIELNKFGKRVAFSSFDVGGKNFSGIEIRDYYKSPSGEMRPSLKGIFLSSEAWRKLVSSMDEMSEAIDNQEPVMIDLDGKKKFTLSNYRGELLVGIRKYYTKDGEDIPRPGKKGTAMKLEEFQILMENTEEIESWLEEA